MLSVVLTVHEYALPFLQNCDDKNPLYLLDDPADCPWNHYRTGPDNSPSFFGGFYHLWHWATPYLAVKKPMPASRPGCYAYPDQLGIGGPVKGTAGWAQARANGAYVATPHGLILLRI